MPTVKCVSSCTACSSAVVRCPVCLLSMIGSHIWIPANCKRLRKSALTISYRTTSLELNYIVQTLVRRVSSAIVVGNLWTVWWTSSWISRLCRRISSRGCIAFALSCFLRATTSMSFSCSLVWFAFLSDVAVSPAVMHSRVVRSSPHSSSMLGRVIRSHSEVRSRSKMLLSICFRTTVSCHGEASSGY